MIDWNLYPNFTFDEMKCSETGECAMHPDMMHVLQQIRNCMIKPIHIASGFRSVKHSVEQSKPSPGEHTKGMAVDIRCHGDDALKIVQLALIYDIRRIGVSQKGDHDSRFIHLGIGNRFSLQFPVGIWSY